ncbi:hypothetical protein Vadar_003664 [Vaccinium darrowii]|uniref:Uncharacterized protein n=1 Tax=Vaccinium darrowii TaxID=229202 RepID=A0ACB7YJF4_9ERIC|nr:hypothetical protein Vadar_003664 [Vaccinium darrowii]
MASTPRPFPSRPKRLLQDPFISLLFLPLVPNPVPRNISAWYQSKDCRRQPPSTRWLLLPSERWVACRLIGLWIFSLDSTTGIDLENPVIDVTPSPLAGYKPSPLGPKDVLLCGRIRVAGQSRLKLGSYATAYQVTLALLVVIPERLYNKIQICFHRNASRGLCQCEKDEWKAVHDGLWSSVMSPYEDRYVDVKFAGDISGSVTVTAKEEFQRWRLLCLALGFILLLLAPVGMKLLPTGRKSALYFTVYGSVLGAGSFLLHYFSMLVNSVLVNFGLSEEMHNPVSVFVLLLIVLAGAALGYCIVRKFVISEDGSVDVGIAQFMKWAMRIIAVTFIFHVM